MAATKSFKKVNHERQSNDSNPPTALVADGCPGALGLVVVWPVFAACRGGGDCSQIDWTLLGGSIANWSFIAFVGLSVLGGSTLWWRWTSRQA
jgi:disulfide bond formation protein DsbB